VWSGQYEVLQRVRERLKVVLPVTLFLMKRIAAPMIGGIFTSFVLKLVVYPAIHEIWKWHFGLKREVALLPAAAD
jgi:Cu/Ag efflux pump CusA